MKKLIITIFLLIPAVLFGQRTFVDGLIIGSSGDTIGSVVILNATTLRFTINNTIYDLSGSLFHSRTSTASDSIDIADRSGKIYMNVAGANNLTVVANSIKSLPVDTEITVINWGAGQTTIVEGAGVTVNSADGALALRVQFSTATLVKKETDIWLLVGDIE